VSQIPCFCRLVPPNFDRDLAFGGTGVVSQRVPGCEFVVPQTLPLQIPNSAEHQIPRVIRRLPDDRVVAAIRCKHWFDINNEINIPNLPLDGSLAMARLI
jgi:hypothetical protein